MDSVQCVVQNLQENNFIFAHPNRPNYFEKTLSGEKNVAYKKRANMYFV